MANEEKTILKEFDKIYDTKDVSSLISGEGEESETFLYDSVVEKKNFEATPRSLMFTGIKNTYTDQPNVHNKGHHRSLSFAETVEPLTLTWQDINVYTEIRATGLCGRSYKTGETRQILENLSGIACPGKILAILGPSGCGKTTLLNVLNDRNLGGLLVEGDVRTNGQAIGSGIKTVSAYVQGTDVFIGNLKVKEHLWFYALMKMDSHFSADDRETRIEELLIDLGLKKCAETYIGSPGTIKGISGGEMKRLSFACELLINPPIMFLDEPTSGLDSFMAENIIYILKKMAGKHKTIICTIHQPNSEIYTFFDEILLMGEGKTIYMGPRKGAAQFFRSRNIPCPINFNPADHYIHCIAASKADLAVNVSVKELSEKYLETNEYALIQKSISESNRNLDNSLYEQTSRIISDSKYKVGWCTQLRGLLWRHWINLIRDTNLFLIRVGQISFLAVMIGLLYYRQNYNDPRGQFNLNGANFLQIILMTHNVLYTVLNTLPSELPIFFREHSAGMYRVDAYFLSRNITDLLVYILMPTILSSLCYGLVMVDHTFEKFIILWLTNISVAKCAVSMGYLVSTVTIEINLSLATIPPILYLLMMTSGYLVNLESILVPFKYIQYISWFRYGYENLEINQWIDVHNVTCVYNNVTTKSPCFSDGADMIRFLEFNPSKNMFYFNFLYLLITIVVIRLVAFIFLYIRCKETNSWAKINSA